MSLNNNLSKATLNGLLSEVKDIRPSVTISGY